VEGGVLRKRLAEAIPSADDFLSAISSMADMKLDEVARLLRKNEAVRFSVRRAAMDIGRNEGSKSLVKRLAMDPKVHELVNEVVRQRSDLTVGDLVNLRQSDRAALQNSVRAALDSLMADEGSKPLATHLKQAYEADNVDDQLRHLNMALDVIDSPAPADEPQKADDVEEEVADEKDDAADSVEAEDAEDEDEGDDVVEDDEDADFADFAESKEAEDEGPDDVEDEEGGEAEDAEEEVDEGNEDDDDEDDRS